MLGKDQRKSADHQVKLSDVLKPLIFKYSNQFSISDNLISVMAHGHINKFTSSVQSFFKEIPPLCQKYGHIPKKLTLKFTYEMSINDKILQAIGEVIQKSFNQLTHFTLILLNCSNTTTQGLSSFMKALSKHLSELKTFSLRISHGKDAISQVTHDFKYILTNPACWKNIENLSLDFQACEIDNTGVKEVSIYLELILPKLKSFSISFNRCTKVSAEGIKYLVKAFEVELPLLESLKIGLAWCVQRTDKHTKTLIHNIVKNAPNLSTLKLDFEGHPKLSDVTIKEIIKLMKNQLTNLFEFALSVAWCNMVTNQGLKDIFTFTLTSLPNLKKASLNFYHCSQIDDNGIAVLIESIKDGYIYYSDSDYLTSEELNQEKESKLSKETKKHKISLREFDIDLTQYKRRSSPEIDEFRKKLNCIIPKLTIQSNHS